VEQRAIVDAIRAGDPSGLAAAYDQYGDRLYGYCASLLKDPDLAADAVHDTLLVAAERIHQLRDPERFRAWLYAIGRNECLRQLRTRRRSVSLEAAAEVSDESIDLDAGPRQRELRDLVRHAVAGLSPRDREVLELGLRHDLDTADVAATLGVSASHARALLSRAREQLERAVGVVLVARDGRNDCPELAAILAGWDGQMTALLRKRVNRHLESCTVCGESRRRVASAPALLGTLPLLLPPPDLRARVLNNAFDPHLVAYRADLGHRAGRMDSNGFPVQHRVLPGSPRAMAAGAAVAVVALSVLLAVFGVPEQQRNLIGLPPFAAATPPDSAGQVGSGSYAGSSGQPPRQVTPASGPRTIASPSPRPSALIVPTEVDLHTASSTQIQISSRSGDISWTAVTDNPSVTVKPAAGRTTPGVDLGSSATISIPFIRSAGKATITFSYPGGSVSTLVTWDQVLLLPPGIILQLPTPTPTPPPIQ
jgi:RNA polymerase sigma factor (sigma-70 family)